MSIRSLIEDIWSCECISNNFTCKEKGKKFILRRQEDEEAVLLNIEQCSEWPNEEKNCDCIVCCRHFQDHEITLVFIELKGVNVKDALSQLKESKRLLCFHSAYVVNKHQEYKRCGFSLSHSKVMRALIIPKRSLPLSQREKSKLRKNEYIDVRQKTDKFEALSVRQLQSFFN